MLAYDKLAELKQVHASNGHAALLLECLVERVEPDGLTSEFVSWVAGVLGG
jgi:hypothetical protein